ELKMWLNRFVLENGFNYKVRTSKVANSIIKRAIYKCIKSGSHILQVTSNPTKRHSTYSQYTQCFWKLNITCSKTNCIVKINSFINEHNYQFTSMIYEIAP
ncbi:16146_t:CDS:1, partial [Cetraspora pellucida]